jgi:cellulose synthase/poly-beta-1,6-N-acetylglucosamine synthase-like glycosyltransferase
MIGTCIIISTYNIIPETHSKVTNVKLIYTYEQIDVRCQLLFFCNLKKELVESECQRWANKGVNIKYENRSNRNGYKAGAMREGLRKSYVKDCEYVAIFDADFQPESDFLWRTIPFLISNHDLALVQARWKFGDFSQLPFYFDFLFNINKYKLLIVKS